MFTHHLGEIAALATAVCWATSATAFAAASRRIGSLTVNFVRMVLAIGLLAIWGLAVRGHAFPADATARQWLWLGISGIVGFTLGDLFLFRAFVEVGARLSMLIMTLAPPLAAVLAWAVLGERISLLGATGIAVTIAGIAWVVLEEQPPVAGVPAPRRARGLLMAFLGAAGQAGGLVLSKLGMGNYDAFAATQIRVIAGTAGFIVLLSALSWWPHVARGIRHKPGLTYSAIGAVFGPFLGVGFSLVAIQHTQTGIAATLMSITPILLIPLALVQREKVTRRAAIGAAMAVGGVALLFLR